MDSDESWETIFDVVPNDYELTGDRMRHHGYLNHMVAGLEALEELSSSHEPRKVIMLSECLFRGWMDGWMVSTKDKMGLVPFFMRVR